MSQKTKFLITFVGLKVKGNSNNPDDPRYVHIIKNITADFIDKQDAETYAKKNIDAYLSLDDGYELRSCVVDDYVCLAQSASQMSAVAGVIQNNLLERLDPLVDTFCQEFWASHRQRSFMDSVLQNKLSTCKTPKERAEFQARFMMQICIKANEVPLRFFHKKVSDSFLEAQIFNRIFRFICPEALPKSQAEEGKVTNAT